MSENKTDVRAGAKDLKARAEEAAGDIAGETKRKGRAEEGAGDIAGETKP